VAWIDFDSARPGPRLHGVAYSAYHFCSTREPLGTITEQDAARMLWFADAYGLGVEERPQRPDSMANRLRWLAPFIRERAAADDDAFAAPLANGHAEPYAAHADLIERSASLRHLLAKGAQP
jgi:hypothetical protein